MSEPLNETNPESQTSDLVDDIDGQANQAENVRPSDIPDPIPRPKRPYDGLGNEMVSKPTPLPS